MNYTLVVIFSFSVAIAAVIGLVRFKKINPVYYPFLICMWLAFLNEILSYILARTIRNNTVNNNIYVLLEALLLTWQFYKWGLFVRTKNLFLSIMSLHGIVWVIEITFISSISHVTFYFQVFYSFVLVLLSIHCINGLIVRERKNVMRSSVFLICIALVSFCTLKVLVLAFWLYGINISPEFRRAVTYTLIYVNLFANLIYAAAVVWMPSKQRFSMPS